MSKGEGAEGKVREIRRRTRRKYSAEEKIRIAGSKKKSDRRDARTLAEALKAGLAENCSVQVPSERARRARSLMHTSNLASKALKKYNKVSLHHHFAAK